MIAISPPNDHPPKISLRDKICSERKGNVIKLSQQKRLQISQKHNAPIINEALVGIKHRNSISGMPQESKYLLGLA